MNNLSRGMIISVVWAVISLIIFGNYQEAHSQPPSMGPSADYIEGKVHVQGGSAAGVWVIAESKEFHTNEISQGNIIPDIYRKIVVTDDQGNFVIPELPNATYDLWVRGYGLKDSTPIKASPSGKKVQLFADLASSPQEAAQVFPAHYWYSLMEFPDDISAVSNFNSNEQWSSTLKLGCQLCHQVGNLATRHPESAEEFDEEFGKSGGMNSVNGWPRPYALDRFGDWGMRIANGEVPPTPPRPQGVERNVVITQWRWGDIFTYAHDEVATDKRDPTMYPNQPVYGVDLGNDWLVMTDPINHESRRVKIPTVGGWDTPWGFCTLGCLGNPPTPPTPPAFVGVYHNPANPHNPMMDAHGHVWMTTQIRDDGDDPDFCEDVNPDDTQPGGTGHRQLGFYDTNNGDMVLIDTCTGTHHLQFDSQDRLWLSGDSSYFGWFDTEHFLDNYDPDTWDNDADSRGQLVFESTDFERMRVDDDCDEDTPPVNIGGFNYGIIADLPDGSVWSASPGFPGEIRRFDPTTRTFEVYDAPFEQGGYGPRGIDNGTDGTIWTCLAGSSHVAKFDRTQCAQTCGSGDQCPEGWTIWPIPGPKFKNTDILSDYHYYNWVDQDNTFGLGENVLYCTGTGSDSIIAFNPQDESFTRIHMPYPLGFFHRGLDGRIDDPDAGWKGRAIWVDYGIDPVLHVEDQKTYIVKVQLRPNPLAK
ncbi:MAG: hypothetical protein WBD99_00135 [Thermodesulfobacteriota bacterium]